MKNFLRAGAYTWLRGSEPIHYVYILLLDEDGPPFYIGEGKEERWNSHEKDALKSVTRPPWRITNLRKHEIVLEVIQRLGYLPKQKVMEGLTKKAAVFNQNSLIAALLDSGCPLTNVFATPKHSQLVRAWHATRNRRGSRK